MSVVAHPAARSRADAVDAIVTVRGISMRYGAVEALRDVDLDFPRGKLTSLLGLPIDANAWSLDDWAVRAIRDGLGGHNATLWAQIAAGRAQLTEAQQSLQELGFRDIVVRAGAPGTPTARFQLS